MRVLLPPFFHFETFHITLLFRASFEVSEPSIGNAFPTFTMLPSHYFNDIFCLHKSLQSNSEGYVLCSTSLMHRLNVIFLLHEASQSSREDSSSSYSRTGRGHKKKKLPEHISNSFFFWQCTSKNSTLCIKILNVCFYPLFLAIWQ